jgi:23S rRNA (cytosine1962-C5)-methyltransferase
MIPTIYPAHFSEYELIDSGGFEKLERFGQYITIRPEPQAVWNKNLSEEEWKQQAHVKFVPVSSSNGKWEFLKKMPENWEIAYSPQSTDDSLQQLHLKFNLALTKFKHVGIFPEQSVNWDFIYSKLQTIKQHVEKPKVLNLFAYTGGSSLAACAGGAETYHVDSIKQVVSWANRNMESSGAERHPLGGGRCSEICETRSETRQDISGYYSGSTGLRARHGWRKMETGRSD